MPFRGPPLELSDDDDDEDDMDEDEEEEEPITLMAPPNARATASCSSASSASSGSGSGGGGGGGLKKAMLSLHVADKPNYDDESPPGAKRGRAPPGRPLQRQDSYDVTPTMTLEVGGMHIKPEGLVEDSPRGGGRAARQLKTNVQYADLESIKVLGRGASAKVFLARHKSTSALYAVKELNAMADEDTRHMAVNELRIQHKHAAHAEHLVRFVDAYYYADKICIAMEFADAGSYEDVIARSCGGVPLDPLAAITLQTLHGLLYLHKEMHQVHRDLKPANVMLTRKGCAKLSDFGISKQLDNTLAKANTQVGTTSYMSPERFRGELYDWLSDVWSVGVMALEALTAEHPFADALKSGMFALNKAICSADAPSSPAGTPEEVTEFIALCLRKEVSGPSARPQVRVLLNRPWLKSAGLANPQQVVQRYLESTMEPVGASMDVDAA